MEKVSWKAPEYIYTEKTPDWYWIVSIVTISVALIAIILNNIIFAILIIVSSITLSLFASRRPLMANMEVGSNGVTKGDAVYPYAELDSFWVETRDTHPRLLLKSKKTLSPYIVLLLYSVNPLEVRAALEKHLPETEHTEPLLEKLLIYFGF